MKSERRPRASAPGRHPYLLLAAALALVSALTLLAAPRAAAAGPTFTVTGTADTIDAASNCAGVNASNLPGPDGVVSLREAICAADSITGGGATVAFATGTNGHPFVLALNPLVDGGVDDGPNDADTGDLDLAQSMTITGNGAGNTIIDGGGTSRLFDTYISTTAITVTISGVTLQNGNVGATDSFVSAGAIFVNSDDAMNISDSVIVNNRATNNIGANGGAIDSLGTLSLDNVTLTGNHATFRGGAVNSVGALTVRNSTITGNTAEFGGGISTGTNNGIATTITNTAITSNNATDTTGGPTTSGGGIGIEATDGQVTITGSTITGNQTLGNGGGVAFSATAANTGSLSLGFNRVAGNTVGVGGNGTGLYTDGTGAVTAQHNWWGCNAGPGSAPCDRVVGPAAAAYTPWLTLGLTASPATITTSQTSTLTASFLKDSAGNAVSAGNLTALVGVSVAFGNAQKGTVSPPSATITASGAATTTFTPNAAGAGSATATVDQQTVTANVTVVAPPSFTSADHTTFVVGQPGSFTVTATGTTPMTLTESGALPIGVTFVDNGGGNATLGGTPAAGTAGTYPFTITASNGILPDATQTFTLTVDQAPSITSVDATTFTVGAAGTFTVTTTGFPSPSLSETGALPSGVTFHDNGDGTATLSGTPAAGTGGTHQLTLTAHNGIGSDATQSFTLTVDEAPAVTSANATTFIVGTAGTFTVTTGGSPTPTLTESGALPASVTFTDNGNGTATLAGTPAPGTGGTYTLTLTAHNGVGADATQSFTLTVDEAPVVTADPLSQTVCLGATVSFTAAASGFPVPTVQWQVSTDGGQTFTDISGATNPTYTIAATTFSERGNYYRAVFTNSVGSATSARALLIVNSPPAITTQPTSQTVTAGQAVSFFSAASGFPVPTAVQWQVSADNGATWTDIPGATHPTLTFTTAGTDNGHQYRAVYTNTCGTATTNAATLVVQGTPVVTTQPASQSANAGQRVTFTAAASGNPAPTVQWQASSDNGATWTSIPGATATTLTVLAAPPVNGNQYRAVFTNVVGSATTDAATLTVNTGAGYSGWVSLGGRLTGTAPAAVTYNGALYVFARGTDFALYVRHSADGATYTPWQRLGGLIDSAPTAAVHDGTLYVFVRGTDNALYETHTGDGATYTPWRRLGGVLTSAPAATTFQGRLVVFAAGADHALYVTSSADGVAYGPWQNLGGRLPDAQADPAALVVSGHGLYAYVRGGDNGLYVTQTTDGVAYSGWRSLGGVLTSGPAAASVNGTLVILARGSDLALYERRSTDGGATYTDWRSLGGILTTAPAATAFQGQVYVFAAGTDDALYTQHTR